MEVDSMSQQCKIKQEITVFCPFCGHSISVPMQQAVNGQEITCTHCNKVFSFREIK